MAEQQFDVVVLGGGSGGYAAALRAAELGKSVALIEKDKVGGTCLHRGCIPTKALLHAAEVADAARESAGFGVRATFEGVDVAGLRAYREGIVAKKYKGLQGLVKARGITVVDGEGRLEPDRAVRVGDDLYRGADVVLATGSYSRSLPGLEIGGRILASEQALALEEIPDRVVILGGGVIGVEFASVWRSFGAEVTIVEALDHLVPNEDAALSKGLERAFRRRGIAFSLGVRFASATQDADGVVVTLEDGTTYQADNLLVAVGRGPATAGLGFEEAGLTIDRGFVIVDERLRTGVDHVWAVGDIVPGLQLAHRGFQQGILVA
ncbi:MAG: FAD-dependent oxidoreductase, partial [Microbacterium sp.]|uniref:FAD-dependent oxidoreductase n=1 Tax=Microbacterium sp. TaxID=51671 RepID=UPI001ACAC9B4